MYEHRPKEIEDKKYRPRPICSKTRRISSAFGDKLSRARKRNGPLPDGWTALPINSEDERAARMKSHMEVGRDAAESAAPVSGWETRAGSAASVSGWAARATEPVQVIDTRDDFIPGEKTWAEACSDTDSSTAEMGTVPASGTPAPGTEQHPLWILREQHRSRFPRLLNRLLTELRL